jgi:hypothetical protein
MTRRSSQRALAQEVYREMASQTPLIPANAGIQSDPARPVNGAPGSPSQVGYSRLAHISWQTSGIPDVCARGRTEESLTAKARALYENSAVPVAEIARLTGVTERTIYKYAAKGRWTPRYRWSAAHPRRWRAGVALAPVKGAGARFIRRADKSKRFAVGLKATDPAGAARAAADCARADALSRAAQKEARTDYYHKQRQRAWRQINRMLGKINDYADEYAKKHPGYGMRARVPADDVLMNAMHSALAGWTDWLEALRREEAEEAAKANASP